MDYPKEFTMSGPDGKSFLYIRQDIAATEKQEAYARGCKRAVEKVLRETPTIYLLEEIKRRTE